MKAAVLENNKFVVKEIPKPLLDEYGEGAIVKVIGCGLCGSDIVKMRTGKAKNGAVLGHEVVGEIVEINSKTNFEVGEKIALGHHVPCFNCQYCWGGSYSMCRHFKSTNIFPGGFSEYIYVSEEHLNNTVFHANLNISDIEASFLEPLGCCVRAVKRADIKDNSKTLIIGLGSVGILMGETVKAFGNSVYGCDLIYERVCLSEKLGFDKSFYIKEEKSTLLEMQQSAINGFDTVFLTAGASPTIDFALKAVRDGGTIVVFSSVKDNAGFINNDIYYRELKIMGSYSPSPSDLDDSRLLIESGKVKVTGLSSVYSLDKINDALNDTISNKIMKAYIQI
jgi:L-iditol 2-dehydrogenase